MPVEYGRYGVGNAPRFHVTPPSRAFEVIASEAPPKRAGQNADGRVAFATNAIRCGAGSLCHEVDGDDIGRARLDDVLAAEDA